MPYSPINRIQYGGSSSTSPAWYGDGRDGTLSTSGNVTLLAANGDSTSTIKYYESLTVNSGHTLSAGYRTRALVIYVRGSAVINGSITMGNGAAAAASVINLTRYDVNGLTGTSCEPANTVNFTTPALSATGGASRVPGGGDSAGNAGSAGTNGQTGGGGSGGFSTSGSGSSGAGATGTSYSGGAGGGAARNSTGGAGTTNGGVGGAGTSGDSNGCGGGAGNPGGAGSGTGSAVAGSTGTGGTLILIVGGNLTLGGSAVISANGSNGGSADLCGGGASGGGRVIVLYAGTLSNSGSVAANGGAGGTATRAGGAGGAGSISGPTQVGR